MNEKTERKPLSAQYVGQLYKAAKHALSDVGARRRWADSKLGSPVGTVNLCAEIARLHQQIEDAEIALNTWDSAHDSEYWLRHPRDPGDLIATALTSANPEPRP